MQKTKAGDSYVVEIRSLESLEVLNVKLFFSFFDFYSLN